MEKTTKKYAHEIVPHLDEGETKPLDYLVRYHYAQAQAWHLSFAEAINSGDFDFPLSQYLGHAHLAFLHDSLAQGMSGQEAADWASERTHSESCELVWERANACGLPVDEIGAYAWRRKTNESGA